MRTSCILTSFLTLASGFEMEEVPEVPDPSGCAVLVTGSIDDVVNSAYDIAQAALDCSAPSLSQTACASDLTDMMSYWFNLANKISSATSACGSLNNACAADITQALGDVSDVSNNLVASAGDCVTNPFICSYDVVSAVDCVNGVVGDVLMALSDCEFSELPEAARSPLLEALATAPPAREKRLRMTRSAASTQGAVMERRLAEKAPESDAFAKLQFELEDGFQKWAGLYRSQVNATSGASPRKTHEQVQSALAAAGEHLRAQLASFTRKGGDISSNSALAV